jgi:Rrf2 family protein
MHLSTRGQYATRALVELAGSYGRGVVKLHQIAERQNIPFKYLEQIMLQLKRFGFVDSRKGAEGGYVLKRPPEAITLGEVIRALEGPLAPIGCVSQSGYTECGCPDAARCGLRSVWQEVRDAIAGILDHTTLQDVRDREEKLRQTTGGYAYYEI